MVVHTLPVSPLMDPLPGLSDRPHVTLSEIQDTTGVASSGSTSL